MIYLKKKLLSTLGILQPGDHWYFSKTVSITLFLGTYSQEIIRRLQKTLGKKVSQNFL